MAFRASSDAASADGEWSSGRWRRTRWCASILPRDGQTWCDLLHVVSRNQVARGGVSPPGPAAPAQRTRPSRQRVERWAPIGAPVEAHAARDGQGRQVGGRCVTGRRRSCRPCRLRPREGIDRDRGRSSMRSTSGSTVSAKRDCSRRRSRRRRRRRRRRAPTSASCPPRTARGSVMAAMDVERLLISAAGFDRLFTHLDRRHVRATLREHGGDRSDGGDVRVGFLDERLDHPRGPLTESSSVRSSTRSHKDASSPLRRRRGAHVRHRGRAAPPER